MTRALVEANRRNARKSTGPRTAAGKERSRLNGLRHGDRSPEYNRFADALLAAPPYAVLRHPELFLTRAESDRRIFVDFFELCWEAELGTLIDGRADRQGSAERFANDDRSRNVV
ncbi:MAG TPA: hypothetical protein VL523_16710 [Terriglobia bacterium]|nr:hypothetical protein [Terriglobia bacterium]